MASDATELRNWLNRQSHLPKNIDDTFLFSFIYSCYHDIEKAKIALELFLTIRKSSKELLSNRDLMSPPMQKALSIVNGCFYNISGKRKLWVWQINDPGFNNYDYFQDLKLVTVLMDTCMLENYSCSDGDIFLIDCKDVCLKILKTFSLSTARKIYTLAQDANPMRLKQIHLVNCPPVLDKVFAFVKPILRQEIIDIIHFHLPQSNTIFQHLSKEDLPTDYGGILDSTEIKKSLIVSTAMKYRDVLNENLWVAIGKKENETMDMGSFRTLDID